MDPRTDHISILYFGIFDFRRVAEQKKFCSNQTQLLHSVNFSNNVLKFCITFLKFFQFKKSTEHFPDFA